MKFYFIVYIFCFRVGYILATPQRVVSLVPSVSDLMQKMKLDSKLVGVSDYCIILRCSQIAKIGSLNIRLEKLISMRPNIIFISYSTNKKIIKQLNELNIPYQVFKHQTIADIFQNIQKLGQIFNVSDKANQLISNLIAKIKLFKNKLKNKKIMITMSSNIKNNILLSSLLVGKKNYYQDLLNILGAKNIVNFNSYKQVSISRLIRMQPDIIFYISRFKSSYPMQKIWKKIYPNVNFKTIAGVFAVTPSQKIITLLNQMTNLH